MLRKKINTIIKTPIHPILFGLSFLLSMDIPISDPGMVLGSVILLFVITGIIYFGAYKLTKDKHRAGFISILFLGWAFYFGTIGNILVSILGIKNQKLFYLYFIIPWSLIFVIAGSTFIWLRINWGRNITIYLNIVTIAILLYFGLFVFRIETHSFIKTTLIPSIGGESSKHVNDALDIYYIILDSYARADVLEEMYSYDNSEFIKFLTDRGFYVANKSTSNYMATELSLSSSLNMSYLDSIETGRLSRASIFKRIISDNQVRSILQNQGYQFVSFSTPIILI